MNNHKFLLSALVVILLLTLTAGGALAQGPTPPIPSKSITGVTAGTGLTGGGMSGVVTLAVANTYQLPQVCANGQLAMWNGTKWACMNDGLTLPFVASVTENGTAFEIANAGSGNAAIFRQTNTTNLSDTMFVTNLGGGRAIAANNRGTGGVASFGIPNPANNNTALEVATQGTGNAINAVARTGTTISAAGWGNGTVISATTENGRPGFFQITSPTNVKPALEVATNGTGNAGSFKIDNHSSNNNALRVDTNGNMPALGVYQTGMSHAGRFDL